MIKFLEKGFVKENLFFKLLECFTSFCIVLGS